VTTARCAAIVTAAGASARMGGAGKKEYRSLDGVPVLARALSVFLSSAEFSRVVVTVPPGDIPRACDVLGPHLCRERVRLVEGGATRQKSVALALRTLGEAPPAFVLIHDAARPWVDASLVERVLVGAERFGACLPAVEVWEAVKQTGESGLIARHFPRHTIRLAQTPQGFSFPEILRAHDMAESRNVLCADDAELYDLFVGPVAWVEGDRRNRKITWPEDLEGE
jgi:2-C-methyl-D-erythritol 4-phosphate cytidylyltransferase